MFGPACRHRVLAAAWLALLPLPAHAQDVPPPPADDGLDPDAPLADLPGIGVDWPDLAKAPVDDAADAAAGAQVGAEVRYDYALAGIDGVGSPLLLQRFNAASTLRANRGDPANAAQIDRRAREDSTLLQELLRAEGYYDARVATRVEPRGQTLAVTLEVEPGALYRFNQVTLAGVEAAGDKSAALTRAFDLAPEAPVNSDAVAAAEERLRATVGEQGFAFGRVGESEIVVDRASRTATLTLPVEPGSERRFGRIRMDQVRVFGPRHVQEIARFTPGQPYSASALVDLRRALVQTGLVSSARVEPVDGSTPGTVDVAVDLEPAPPRTIAGELGYGTGEGARAEVSWTHRNLFPPEGALTVRGVLGTREQLGAITFRRNNYRGRDRVLTIQTAVAHTERDAYEADTVQLSGTLERQTNIFFQKAWTWSLGAELVATDERDVIVSTGAPRRRTYFIGALPTSLTYDGSDDLLNPTRGFRLGGRISPELSLVGTAFGYTRTQLDASAYHPVSSSVVLAGRVRLGTILGAPRDAVAPSRRFYAGGGASVRGYGYQSIGPRDPNNDPIGGRSLTEFALEARVRAFGNFGIVPFLDGGNIYTDALPRFSGFRYGAGLGFRYYSNFGPIRFDVGTPLNPQRGDSRIAVSVSLGQAF
ncbi:autotransporter secretion outer membrane protein TamA [Sphingomonas guangdongensis]|uniref:Autotransporter secretion outer membrane protein TamA n=1 Tax=Sphingomonas guangdongensis TaxID=1141890 RepID=A0A285QCU7_9SPHN|nr:autotransporter assembly complex family protein [Sphingomonas guangdongensis]SOB79279.1 autotransporter secretion outer membrane protein TamA [Sphingomonas guangdongensis]